jgi:cytidine deaminase
MMDDELIAIATALVGEYRTSEDCFAGGVAAAVLSRSGKVYSGICIDTECSMGFCAEHSAIAEMLKARDPEIAVVVAVMQGRGVVSPCGRCREFMWQVHPSNRTARIILGGGRSVTLAELLPMR